MYGTLSYTKLLHPYGETSHLLAASDTVLLWALATSWLNKNYMSRIAQTIKTLETEPSISKLITCCASVHKHWKIESLESFKEGRQCQNQEFPKGRRGFWKKMKTLAAAKTLKVRKGTKSHRPLWRRTPGMLSDHGLQCQRLGAETHQELIQLSSQCLMPPTCWEGMSWT